MPQTMLLEEVVKSAVLLACRAPSVHNSQPWLWVYEDATLQLFHDPRRRVRNADRCGQEAIISCGVVLDHLRVAMAAGGWQAQIDRFPDPNNPDHLASVRFGPLEFVTDTQRQRADAVLQRRTDRLADALSDILGSVRTHAAQQRRRERRDAWCAIRWGASAIGPSFTTH